MSENLNGYSSVPKISVIIPVYNEESTIIRLLNHLKIHGNRYNIEILVIDGRSTDQTVEKVRKSGVSCIQSKRKGRSAQMNLGATHSAGDILYFVHADTIPPATFEDDILKAVVDGFDAGCYRFKYDSAHTLLKINAFFTRFDRLMCRGGDQTLFVKRSLFNELGGYREDFAIMEDFDLIARIRSRAKFKIIPKNVVVSARKYRNNNYFKVNLVNLVVFILYFLGASQDVMVHTYRRFIHKTKFK